MGLYEPTVLHHIENRTSGMGKTELGLLWYAEKLKRDMDRAWRHFWDQPHRRGMEPPPSSWQVTKESWFTKTATPDGP